MVSVDFLRNSPLLGPPFTEHAEQSDTPAIEPTLDLYRYAQDRGMATFFISGRKTPLADATEANLENVGYTDYTRAFFAPESYDQESIVPFKSRVRAKIEDDLGYTIVANVGDQLSDLEGGHAICRHKLVDPYYFIP